MAVAHSYSKAVTSLAAGAFYVIGPGGDDDPGYALEDVVFVNTGTVALRFGHSLTDIITNARYQNVAAAASVGCTTAVAGPIDNLIVYNFDAATAAAFTVIARCVRRNSGKDGGVLCASGTPGSATRYQVIRVSKVAGANTTTTVPVKYKRTLTTIKGYSVTVANGGTITIDLKDTLSRSLLASVMNAEDHTTKTLYTTTTLSTTVPLTVDRDCSLIFSSSAGGDTVGDALVELAHTVA